MSAPKVRFKGFSRFWEKKAVQQLINTIDSGWSPLCEVCPADGDEWGVLKTTAVTWTGYSDIENKALPTKLSPRPQFEVNSGDILITRAGPVERVGVVCHVDRTRPKLMLSDKLIRLKCNESTSSSFLSKVFGSKNIQIQLQSLKSGLAAAQTNISQSGILNIEVVLPVLAEQTKIASFLTAVDEKISQLTRKHELLTQYKKGVIQQIFSQELRFKDDNRCDFPEWKGCEIKDIAEVNPKSTSLPDKFVYIDLESVEKGQLLKESIISKESAPSRAQRLLHENDVLFQMVRPYQGNNLLFNSVGNYVASTGYAQLRASDSPAFLYYLLHLESFTAEVLNRCTGTSYPAINSSDLATIPIFVPCTSEQTKIANFLTAIDEKITATKTQLEAVKQYKQGLLQQMFV